MRWDGMADVGRKGTNEVMRWDMGGGKGGSRVGCGGVPGDGGWMMGVCVVGRDDGCWLGGGESMRGRVIFTFFLAGLVGWGPGAF